ncbi:MAG: bifunctional folylpolyglutamate synthase/dihydrofolate synthase [Lachnospiraceae bacterium]|nr:bifunctional folylpolyglutamate synthase/dihydrofolate synthase [Lachnospiraceae bacterium]
MADSILTGEEVQKFLEETGKLGSVLGLDSIRELMNELGNVQEMLPVIHVAGTNGKGSVCAMVSSILQEAGYRVGMYTSPAVFGRKEQYQVNGRPVSEMEFAELITEVKRACDKMTERGLMHPTLFEVETAAAFLHFYRKRCQAVLLETGMGGDMDATNIIRKPSVSVLTSISMDHMKFLGDSLEKIARAKAGIIKENGFAAAARPRNEGVRKVLEEVCEKKNAKLVYAEKEKAENIHIENDRQEGQNFLCFSYGIYGNIRLAMTGACQIENGICAIETAELLRKQGWSISNDQIRRGLSQARWEGRFSRLCRDPLLIIDGAHNEDAAKKLRETLKMGFTNYKIIYIIGVLADKEYDKMLEIMMPLAWKVFTVTPNHPRALDGAVLAEQAEACREKSLTETEAYLSGAACFGEGLTGTRARPSDILCCGTVSEANSGNESPWEKYTSDILCCGTVSEGLEKAFACAQKAAGEKVMILAFGSLSYLGEIREIVRRNRL